MLSRLRISGNLGKSIENKHIGVYWLAKPIDHALKPNVNGLVSFCSRTLRTPTKLICLPQVRPRYLHISPRWLSGKIEQFKLPDIGEGIHEVIIRGWNVKVGDNVKEFDAICEVESDKATATISSRFEGQISRIYYEVGDKAEVGQPLVDISVMNGSGSRQEPDLDDQRIEERKDANHVANHRMLPSVRRLAMQLGVDLNKVKPTGRGGRIEKADIMAVVNDSEIDEQKSDDRSKPEPLDEKSFEDIVPIRGVRKAMFKTMTKSLTIPHFNYSDEIDMSTLHHWSLEQKGASTSIGKISSLAIMVKMLSMCLNQYPELNASIDETGENLIVKRYHNIGIAIDTQAGLVVPNIKNVQTLSISEIDSEIKRLRQLSYDSKLGPVDLSNGTISLSNIGAVGGVFGVPVLVVPEIVIGALGKIRKLPRFDDKGQVVAQHILQVVWSADHRVVDGATLSRFSNLFKSYLEDPKQALLKLV